MTDELAQETPEAPRQGRSSRSWGILTAVVVVGVTATWLWWASGDGAQPDGLLYANGRLEAVSVRVSAEVTGRVIESSLVEGGRAAVGDVLARIDNSELQAELAAAQAEAEARGRVLERIDHELRTWRHHLSTATAELERAKNLEITGAGSEQRRDQAEDGFEEARGRVGGLEAQRRETESLLEAAGRRVELLEIRLEKTEVRAPFTGRVLLRTIEVGELATPGRVIAVLADMSKMELRVFVPEAEIGKIRLGAESLALIDAFPQRPFPAVVSRVDQEAQFTPREVHMPDERVRMVFGVTLAVPNPEGFLKPGMPADAWIRWREDATWPDPLPSPP